MRDTGRRDSGIRDQEIFRQIAEGLLAPGAPASTLRPRRMTRRNEMSHVAVMRNGLRESARELQKIREQLLELKKLSPPPREDLDEDAERDPLSEMEATIECG